MFPNWAKNILFLLVYMISGLVLAIIIEGLLSGSELLPLNTVIEQVVTQMRAPFLTTLVVFVTKLGNPFVFASATVLIVVILIVRGHFYDAALFAVAMTVAVISLTVLENTFQITRPGSELLDFEGWSFPSGHATIATAFFFLLAHSFFGKMSSLRNKIFLILGSTTGVAVICFSRLYLGAHWTLDILAGVALGLLSVSFIILLFGIFVEGRRSLKNRINS